MSIADNCVVGAGAGAGASSALGLLGARGTAGVAVWVVAQPDAARSAAAITEPTAAMIPVR